MNQDNNSVNIDFIARGRQIQEIRKGHCSACVNTSKNQIRNPGPVQRQNIPSFDNMPEWIRLTSLLRPNNVSSGKPTLWTSQNVNKDFRCCPMNN